MNSASDTNPARLLSDYKSHKQTLSADINYFEQGMPERVRLERFISRVYKKYYNAEIDHFYPDLISIETDEKNSLLREQSIKAVAGVRCAENEALFSEHYLNNNLQSELERIYHKPVSRREVVEVGNLAPEGVGQMRWLITTLTGFLYSADYKYIVFTLVPGVYNAFKRMNIPLEFMAEAKRECLPEDIRHKWGPDYYQKKPVVLAGDIALTFAIVKENIYKTNKELIPLFEQAYYLGQKTSHTIHFKKKQLKDNQIEGKAA